ncbi:MAG: TVP38/TMEM64 family protein [Verrucomicrobia bacterium]|nr:TVP38/TMEM64 family protein [Verrucomicrobiota bacterium]
MPSRTLVVFMLLVVGGITAFGFSTQFNFESASFEAVLQRSGMAAPIVFSLLMILGILVSPIPTSPLTILSPKLFGIGGGLLITLLSATIGAVLAFLIARKLGERFFVRFPQYDKFRPWLPRDVTAFAIFLLRLPPSPTFDLVSYLAGLTNISLGQFIVATFLGMIPVTATLCFLGSVTPTVWLLPGLVGLSLFGLVRFAKRRQMKLNSVVRLEQKATKPTERDDLSGGRKHLREES